jgi:Flp pilus assembly pilin Flp
MSRSGASPERGQAMVDYLLVASLVALALSLGAGGPIERLVDAVKDRYARFTWSVSLP